jgi:ribosome-associated protein
MNTSRKPPTPWANAPKVTVPTFSLDGRPHVALHNLLQLEGWCESGGVAKHRIDAGEVSVDGHPELRRRCKIVAGQTVRFGEFVVLVSA